ncbi:MAG: ATP cone domain-containing protein, partial [Aerococcus urinaeequi]
MAQSVQEILHQDSFDQVKVHKRDGRTVAFDVDKLQRSIIKASQSKQAETADINLILHQVLANLADIQKANPNDAIEVTTIHHQLVQVIQGQGNGARHGDGSAEGKRPVVRHGQDGVMDVADIELDLVFL